MKEACTNFLRSFFPGPPVGVREGRALAIILAVAFGLRMAWFRLFPFATPNSDSSRYHDRALEILLLGRFGYPEPTAFEPPGYPAFLSLVYSLFGSDNFVSMFEAQNLIAILTILLIHAVFRITLGVKTALLAAALMAVNPPGIVFPSLMMSEVLALFLFALFVYLRFRFADDWKLLALSGIPLGLAALTREVFLVFIGLHLLWHLSRCVAARRLLSFHTIAPFLCALLVIAPWTARNYRAVGVLAPISTNASENLYYGNNPDRVGFTTLRPYQQASEKTQYILLRADAVDFIMENPSVFVARIPLKLRRLIEPIPYEISWASMVSSLADWSRQEALVTFSWLIHALIFAGFLFAFATRQRALLFGVGDWPVLALSTALVCVATFGDPRFRYLFEPWMMAAVAVSLMAALGRGAES